MSQLALASSRPPLAHTSPIEATLRRIGIAPPALLRQPAVRRALPLLLGLLLVAALVTAALSFRAPDRATVFPGLGDADKAAIVDALKIGGFDVTVDRDTGEVKVPANALYRARMALAAAGLPKAVPGGYDLLANMPLGASRALERARLKQADEGELARAIGGVGGVASARVLLALPDPSPFVRDSVPPSASVFVTLLPGRALGDAQVRAVQHLVASSVPGLPPERVSVVDGAGAAVGRARRWRSRPVVEANRLPVQTRTRLPRPDLSASRAGTGCRQFLGTSPRRSRFHRHAGHDRDLHARWRCRAQRGDDIAR